MWRTSFFEVPGVISAKCPSRLSTDGKETLPDPCPLCAEYPTETFTAGGSRCCEWFLKVTAGGGICWNMLPMLRLTFSFCISFCLYLLCYDIGLLCYTFILQQFSLCYPKDLFGLSQWGVQYRLTKDKQNNEVVFNILMHDKRSNLNQIWFISCEIMLEPQVRGFIWQSAVESTIKKCQLAQQDDISSLASQWQLRLSSLSKCSPKYSRLTLHESGYSLVGNIPLCVEKMSVLSFRAYHNHLIFLHTTSICWPHFRGQAEIFEWNFLCVYTRPSLGCRWHVSEAIFSTMNNSPDIIPKVIL